MNQKQKASWGLLALLVIVGGCRKEQEQRPARTLSQAREIVLELFRELDGFQLEKQTQMQVLGHSAVRMEASWKHEGQRQKGIVCIIEHPMVFNVIHYTAPLENELFELGLPVFEQVLSSVKPSTYLGPLKVSTQGEEKILKSSNLQLEIRYPKDWEYSLDEVSRALVLSGPKKDPTWLTTINFSIVFK